MQAVATVTSKTVITSADMQAGLAAGFFGGLAEVMWIGAYQSVHGHDPALVARGVIGTIFPALADGSYATTLGVSAHMAIALVLGVALAVGARRFLSRAASPAKALAVFSALIVIWAINFFVVLPIWNPGFATIVPYGVSLISKALFGVAAAFALVRMYRGAKT